MNWIWWWVVGIFFAFGGFASLRENTRNALRTRHKRKMERLKYERKEREALEAAGRPPEAVCGCTHHLAKHDRAGKCHEVVEVPTAWDADKKATSYERGTCTCQQYVGPQPLSRIYAEEIADL